MVEVAADQARRRRCAGTTLAVPGRIDRHPTTARQFGRLFKEAAKAAGLRKACGHSSNPSVEDGKDIGPIQALLGQKSSTDGSLHAWRRMIAR